MNAYSNEHCFGRKILKIQTNIDLDKNIAGKSIKFTDFKASIYMNPNFDTDLPDEFCVEYTNPFGNSEKEFMYYKFSTEQLFEGFSLTIPVLVIELVKLQSTYETESRWPLAIDIPAEFNHVLSLNGTINSYKRYDFLLEQKGATGLDWDLVEDKGLVLKEIKVNYIKRPNGMPHYIEGEPEITYWRKASKNGKPLMLPGPIVPYGRRPI